MIKLYRYLFWANFFIWMFHAGVYVSYCIEYILYDIVTPPLEILKCCIIIILAMFFADWSNRKIKQARNKAVVEVVKND